MKDFNLKQLIIWFMNSDYFTWVFTGLVVVVVMIALVYYLQISREEKFEQSVFKKEYKTDEKKSFIRDKILRTLHENIISLMAERGKSEEAAEKAMDVILISMAMLSIFMFIVKQPVFAILMPIILLFIITKMTGMIKRTFSDFVQEQLPQGIDNIIRVFSGYNDLRMVLYEAGATLPNPMKQIFQDLSRKMQSEQPSVVLNEYMEDAKDIWIYCFMFNLLAYTEDADKKSVIDNLRELKNIIGRENAERMKQRLERKTTITINYGVCAMAVAGFLLNLMLNASFTIDFFFGNIIGIVCFLLGFTLLITSVFTNILIGSGKD